MPKVLFHPVSSRRNYFLMSDLGKVWLLFSRIDFFKKNSNYLYGSTRLNYHSFRHESSVYCRNIKSETKVFITKAILTTLRESLITVPSAHGPEILQRKAIIHQDTYNKKVGVLKLFSFKNKLFNYFCLSYYY